MKAPVSCRFIYSPIHSNRKRISSSMSLMLQAFRQRIVSRFSRSKQRDWIGLLQLTWFYMCLHVIRILQIPILKKWHERRGPSRNLYCLGEQLVLQTKTFHFRFQQEKADILMKSTVYKLSTYALSTSRTGPCHQDLMFQQAVIKLTNLVWGCG